MNKINRFLFRGKSLSFKAVKSQMTQEIVNAFYNYENQIIEVPEYDDKGNLKKKPTKYRIADELGGLLDSVSVDPNTGKVDLVMMNVLPAAHLGGAPFPVEEDDEYEGIPMIEWDDPDVIQKWIDKNLKGLVIVKNVKPEGSMVNLVEGVWNGDIPVGMNVTGKSIANIAMIKNILVARSLKAMNPRIRKASMKIARQNRR